MAVTQNLVAAGADDLREVGEDFTLGALILLLRQIDLVQYLEQLDGPEPDVAPDLALALNHLVEARCQPKGRVDRRGVLRD